MSKLLLLLVCLSVLHCLETQCPRNWTSPKNRKNRKFEKFEKLYYFRNKLFHEIFLYTGFCIFRVSGGYNIFSSYETGSYMELFHTHKTNDEYFVRCNKILFSEVSNEYSRYLFFCKTALSFLSWC